MFIVCVCVLALIKKDNLCVGFTFYLQTHNEPMCSEIYYSLIMCISVMNEYWILKYLWYRLLIYNV